MKKVKGSSAPQNSELSILKKLDHPNVTKVYDHFTVDQCLYLVLELAECNVNSRS